MHTSKFLTLTFLPALLSPVIALPVAEYDRVQEHADSDAYNASLPTSLASSSSPKPTLEWDDGRQLPSSEQGSHGGVAYHSETRSLSTSGSDIEKRRRMTKLTTEAEWLHWQSAWDRYLEYLASGDNDGDRKRDSVHSYPSNLHHNEVEPSLSYDDWTSIYDGFIRYLASGAGGYRKRDSLDKYDTPYCCNPDNDDEVSPPSPPQSSLSSATPSTSPEVFQVAPPPRGWSVQRWHNFYNRYLEWHASGGQTSLPWGDRKRDIINVSPSNLTDGLNALNLSSIFNALNVSSVFSALDALNTSSVFGPLDALNISSIFDALNASALINTSNSSNASNSFAGELDDHDDAAWKATDEAHRAWASVHGTDPKEARAVDAVAFVHHADAPPPGKANDISDSTPSPDASFAHEKGSKEERAVDVEAFDHHSDVPPPGVVKEIWDPEPSPTITSGVSPVLKVQRPEAAITSSAIPPSGDSQSETPKRDLHALSAAEIQEHYAIAAADPTFRAFLVQYLAQRGRKRKMMKRAPEPPNLHQTAPIERGSSSDSTSEATSSESWNSSTAGSPTLNHPPVEARAPVEPQLHQTAPLKGGRPHAGTNKAVAGNSAYSSNISSAGAPASTGHLLTKDNDRNLGQRDSKDRYDRTAWDDDDGDIFEPLGGGLPPIIEEPLRARSHPRDMTTFPAWDPATNPVPPEVNINNPPLADAAEKTKRGSSMNSSEQLWFPDPVTPQDTPISQSGSVPKMRRRYAATEDKQDGADKWPTNMSKPRSENYQEVQEKRDSISKYPQTMHDEDEWLELYRQAYLYHLQVLDAAENGGNKKQRRTPKPDTVVVKPVEAGLVETADSTTLKDGSIPQPTGLISLDQASPGPGLTPQTSLPEAQTSSLPSTPSELFYPFGPLLPLGPNQPPVPADRKRTQAEGVKEAFDELKRDNMHANPGTGPSSTSDMSDEEFWDAFDAWLISGHDHPPRKRTTPSDYPSHPTALPPAASPSDTLSPLPSPNVVQYPEGAAPPPDASDLLNEIAPLASLVDSQSQIPLPTLPSANSVLGSNPKEKRDEDPFPGTSRPVDWNDEQWNNFFDWFFIHGAAGGRKEKKDINPSDIIEMDPAWHPFFQWYVSRGPGNVRSAGNKKRDSMDNYYPHDLEDMDDEEWNDFYDWVVMQHGQGGGKERRTLIPTSEAELNNQDAEDAGANGTVLAVKRHCGGLNTTTTTEDEIPDQAADVCGGGGGGGGR